MVNFTTNILQEEVNRTPMQNQKLYRNSIPQAKGMFADLEATQRAALTRCLHPDIVFSFDMSTLEFDLT